MNTTIKIISEDVIEKKEHYYGMIKKLDNGNDISFLNRGSVYYLVDNGQKNPNGQLVKHPYIILQSTYLDTIGRITTFSISSTPTRINMIPIIMKGRLGYIDPHHPYIYKVSDFFNEESAYIGNITNDRVIDLISNMYGMHLGMNLAKSNDEIINDYLNYVEEFNMRSKGVERYECKIAMKNPDLEKLDLHISFINTPFEESDEIRECSTVYDDSEYDTVVENVDEEYHDTITEVNVFKNTTDDEPIIDESVEYTVQKESEDEIENQKKPWNRVDQKMLAKAVRMYNSNKYTVDEILQKTGISYSTLYRAIKGDGVTLRSEKKMIEVFVNDPHLLSIIGVMESSPVGSIKFQPRVDYMSDEDISILFLYVHLNSYEDAALLYNCSVKTIEYRMRKIRENYDIRIH